MDTLALTSRRGYGLPVTVNPVTGIGVPDELADTPPTSGFFVSAARAHLYGWAVWWHLRMRRFQFPVRQRHTVPPSLIGVSWAEKILRIGAFPMTKRRVLTLNPSKARARFHRACALAALRADSSLSVRLARYNAAMAKVRALEAQGVDHAAS